MESKDNLLWCQERSTLLPVLNLVRETLPASEENHILFRRVTLTPWTISNDFSGQDNNTLTNMKIWTNSLSVAFYDPYKHLVGRMNCKQRRMIKRGLKEEVNTNHGWS